MRDWAVGTNNYKAVDVPEAADLADLTGIRDDLTSVVDFCIKLREICQTRRGADFILMDAIWTAITIRYGRCFASGVRKKLDALVVDLVSELSAEQRSTHELLLTLRNRYAAHSVNALEENQPVVRYWEERVHAEGFLSVECNTTRQVGVSGDELDRVQLLANALLNVVNRRTLTEKKRVLSLLRSRPVAEVLESQAAVPRPRPAL